MRTHTVGPQHEYRSVKLSSRVQTCDSAAPPCRIRQYAEDPQIIWSGETANKAGARGEKPNQSRKNGNTEEFFRGSTISEILWGGSSFLLRTLCELRVQKHLRYLGWKESSRFFLPRFSLICANSCPFVDTSEVIGRKEAQNGTTAIDAVAEPSRSASITDPPICDPAPARRPIKPILSSRFFVIFVHFVVSFRQTPETISHEGAQRTKEFLFEIFVILCG